MLILFQVVLICIALAIMSSVVRRARQRQVGRMEAVLWVVACLGGIGVVAIPNATNRLADFFGIGRGVDVIVYAAIALLFYLVFRVQIRLEATQRDITALVRDRAVATALEEEDKA